MSTAQADTLKRAIEAGVLDDWDVALELLGEVAFDAQTVFSTVCGMANMLATIAALSSDPDATGPLICELERQPDAPPTPVADEAAGLVAAIIPAVGNGDYAGARKLFASITDADVGAVFVAYMFRMTVAAYRDVAFGEAARG